MKHLALFCALGCMVVACAPSTPDVFELYKTSIPVTETARAQYSNCTSAIQRDVSHLEDAGRACHQDYDCRNKIAEQMSELGRRLAATCKPGNSLERDTQPCEIRVINARAASVNGAPLETNPNDQFLAEEYLADQVTEAYKACMAIYDSYANP